MARLYSTLRSTPALAVLDAQFYPGWSLREGPGDGTRAASAASVVATLPQPQHFRDCFYFCQELIQLMESAYIDLNLDSNREHPDHRGWMNVIRHWSWSPMFRVAWVLSAHTFGSRFVSFCETRAGVPRVVDALAVEGIDIAPNAKLADRAKELHDEGKINLAELGILASDAVIRSGPAQRLYLLKLRWSRFLAVSEDRPADPTLGIALVRDSTLLLFRIQDHVRRLGFGSSFMRLIKDHPIKHVSIKPGDYGPTGTLSVSEQDNLTKQLTNMLNDAWLRRPQVG
jgi:hypothetical protein